MKRKGSPDSRRRLTESSSVLIESVRKADNALHGWRLTEAEQIVNPFLVQIFNGEPLQGHFLSLVKILAMVYAVKGDGKRGKRLLEKALAQRLENADRQDLLRIKLTFETPSPNPVSGPTSLVAKNQMAGTQSNDSQHLKEELAKAARQESSLRSMTEYQSEQIRSLERQLDEAKASLSVLAHGATGAHNAKFSDLKLQLAAATTRESKLLRELENERVKHMLAVQAEREKHEASLDKLSVAARDKSLEQELQQKLNESETRRGALVDEVKNLYHKPHSSESADLKEELAKAVRQESSLRWMTESQAQQIRSLELQLDEAKAKSAQPLESGSVGSLDLLALESGRRNRAGGFTSGLVLFPQNLDRILQLRGYSGVQFASMCSVSHGNTAHWLKGRSLPSSGTWPKVEDSLNCPMWLLFHPNGSCLYKKFQSIGDPQSELQEPISGVSVDEPASEAQAELPASAPDESSHLLKKLESSEAIRTILVTKLGTLQSQLLEYQNASIEPQAGERLPKVSSRKNTSDISELDDYLQKSLQPWLCQWYPSIPLERVLEIATALVGCPWSIVPELPILKAFERSSGGFCKLHVVYCSPRWLDFSECWDSDFKNIWQEANDSNALHIVALESLHLSLFSSWGQPFLDLQAGLLDRLPGAENSGWPANLRFCFSPQKGPLPNGVWQACAAIPQITSAQRIGKPCSPPEDGAYPLPWPILRDVSTGDWPDSSGLEPLDTFRLAGRRDLARLCILAAGFGHVTQAEELARRLRLELPRSYAEGSKSL